LTASEFEKLALDAGLSRMGARPRLGPYLAELLRRRAFAYTLARYRIQASLNENRLGLGWIVLRPIMTAAIFGTIFGVILPSSSRPENFVAFLVVGIFIFEFFSKSFSAGAKSITSNASMVRSLSFPRMLLPLSAVLQQVFELIPMLAIMGVIVVAFGEAITWHWLLVIPIILMMTMFNLGVALISARLTVHIRDVTQIVPLLTRILFYTSGIFYSLDQVLADKPTLLLITKFNPVGDYLALVRWAMIESPAPDPLVWWVAGSAAVVTLTLGVVFFWRAEASYGHQ
jgi:teichoic acid transport system permease protein